MHYSTPFCSKNSMGFRTHLVTAFFQESQINTMTWPENWLDFQIEIQVKIYGGNWKNLSTTKVYSRKLKPTWCKYSFSLVKSMPPKNPELFPENWLIPFSHSIKKNIIYFVLSYTSHNKYVYKYSVIFPKVVLWHFSVFVHFLWIKEFEYTSSKCGYHHFCQRCEPLQALIICSTISAAPRSCRRDCWYRSLCFSISFSC